MTKHTEIYNRYDVVKVPFPFTDQHTSKNRPALTVSSAKSFNQAMITSAQHAAWPLDTSIVDLNSAGLPVASIIRLKLFTLDHRLIICTLGHLSDRDKTIFNKNFTALTVD